jgi:hypothetical protein
MKTDPVAGLLGGPHKQNNTTEQYNTLFSLHVSHCNIFNVIEANLVGPV